MKKKIVIGLAVVVGIAVLAGAAYLGVTLMMPGRADNGGPGALALAGGKGVGGKVTFRVELVRAPELPQSAPDVRGQLVEAKDNSLTVSTFGEGLAGGKVSASTSSGSGNSPSTSTGGDSSASTTTEVVVTQNTKVYRDTTFDAMSGGPPADGKIQQKVEPYTLAQAAKDGVDSVTAWGAKRGDRLVADVVVLGRSMIVYQKSGNP